MSIPCYATKRMPSDSSARPACKRLSDSVHHATPSRVWWDEITTNSHLASWAWERCGVCPVREISDQNAAGAVGHGLESSRADRVASGAPSSFCGRPREDSEDDANFRRQDSRWMDSGARGADSLRNGRHPGFGGTDKKNDGTTRCRGGISPRHL